MNTIVNRIKSPTPPFWKKVRTFGLILTGVAGVLTTAPIGLPIAIVTIAGYLTVAGGVCAAVAQAAQTGE
jgi:hypothetical protein